MNHRYRGPREGEPEPVEVREGAGGEPAAFRWRGRRYAVRVVVAFWVEALPWWGAPPGRGELPWWVDRASGQHHALRAAQRQVWRVEAASRSGTTGIYDLSRAPHGWGLDRVLD